MDDSRPEPLSPYFGDYPNGAYFSAFPPPGYEDSDEPDYTVDGDVIRFMWDFGAIVPLWDGNGLMPHDPEWLRIALGLSDSLIEDLRAWGSAMDHLDAHPRLRTEEACRDLERQARALVERLRGEIGDRFTIRYVPW